MAQTGLMFFTSLGPLAMSPRLALWPRSARIWAWLAAGLPVAIQVWPSIKEDYKTTYKSLPPHEPLPGLFAFVESHSTPADRIFTTGPPGLYIVTNRISATRASSITDEIVPSFPGNTDLEKLRPLYDELVEHRPKIVVLDPEHGDRKRRYLAGSVLPFLRDFQYQQISPELFLRPEGDGKLAVPRAGD
jgi:hypothetical protein